ncbi:uncharacterized protein LDX57_011893 [Aspergillus melleus]|uniref:uncharacterized protein n=1 Tax=Aspergillus melleus TaxID=138277 RepID=UPI001E8D4A5C|nr:uncharacterized protein LDX57_011893 [Aspergillus melleus]KAH8434255.1 hypothetical protein LDX57_011893 [Aspergillus melleus]
MLDDPFLLHTIPYDLESADHITTTRAIHSFPSYLETTCNSFHTEPAHEPHSNIEPAKHPAPSPVGALSWLRSCRLIYTEAKPLLANNVSLHICDKVTLGAAFGGRTPSLPLSQIRSLDFCARLEVN